MFSFFSYIIRLEIFVGVKEFFPFSFLHFSHSTFGWHLFSPIVPYYRRNIFKRDVKWLWLNHNEWRWKVFAQFFSDLYSCANMKAFLKLSLILLAFKWMNHKKSGEAGKFHLRVGCHFVLSHLTEADLVPFCFSPLEGSLFRQEASYWNYLSNTTCTTQQLNKEFVVSGHSKLVRVIKFKPFLWGHLFNEFNSTQFSIFYL